MNNQLWVLTTFFNPANYKSRIKNHNIYFIRMSQSTPIYTIELAFGDDPFQIESDLQLRSKDVLWPKERMLNVALSKLPKECKYIAWIDGDVLFPENNWIESAIEKFEKGADLLQLFEEVKHLPPNKISGDEFIASEKGLVWQSKQYPDFIKMRKENKLTYATTGFAWAARREMFENGFYDKHVLGTNDNVIIDSCLNTFELHHYYRAGQGTLILEDMMKWAKNFNKDYKVDYVPTTIHHLFHGYKKNRGYLTREDTVRKHNYDPNQDIKLENDVYVWATEKPELHKEVKDYFGSRNEDELIS